MESLDTFLDLCDNDPEFDSGEDDGNDPFERLTRNTTTNSEAEKCTTQQVEFQSLFGTPSAIELNPKAASNIIGQQTPKTTHVPMHDSSLLVTDPYSLLRLKRNSVQLYADEVQTLELSLKERNLTNQFVPLGKVSGITDKGMFWTSAVLIRQGSGLRTSSNGNSYSIWDISDLDSADTTTLFLFGNSATAETFKFIPNGSLIDIVNPTIMKDNQTGSGSSSAQKIKLSISLTSQIRHIGAAHDLGICVSRRKDGKQCTVPVNKFKCDVCIHHASTELRKLNSKSSKWAKKNFTDYEKAQFAARMTSIRQTESTPGVKTTDFSTKLISTPIQPMFRPEERKKPRVTIPKMPSSSRMELQDNSSSLHRGSTSTGNHSSITFSKDTCPYASLLPKPESIPRTKKELNLDPKITKHLTERDRGLLQRLDKSDLKSDLAAILVGPNAGSKNFLKYLNDSQSRMETSCSKPSTLSGKLTSNSLASNSEPLPKGGPVVMTREAVLNMQKALKYVRNIGPIQKKSGNEVKSKGKRSAGDSVFEPVKIPSKGIETSDSVPTGNQKIVDGVDVNSDEFQRILKAKSAFASEAEANQEEEYFKKLERKEGIETKLLSTFSMTTTAVMCRQCKYVALSQSEYCKENSHPIRTVKAVKRFFKCKDCGNRTMSLDRLPQKPCSHCKSSSWMVTSVGKERAGPTLDSERLSLRGDEEKFLGSTSAKLFL